MVLGVCVVIASAIVLSACTEIIQSGEAANTSNPEEITSTPKKTESPKVATEATIKVTTKPLIPATPGKVSGVPVEQSPDVFDDVIKRNEVLKGTDIPFTVEKRHCSYQGHLPKIRIFIIRSSNELIIANKVAFKEATTDYANGGKYNDEYFKENALILLIMTYDSTSYIIDVDSITKKNNELSFNIIESLHESNIGSDGEIYLDGQILIAGNYIELKKSEISNVDFTSYYITFKLLKSYIKQY